MQSFKPRARETETGEDEPHAGNAPYEKTEHLEWQVIPVGSGGYQ